MAAAVAVAAADRSDAGIAAAPSTAAALGLTECVESLVGAIRSVLAVDTDSLGVSASAATTAGDEVLAERCFCVPARLLRLLLVRRGDTYLDWDSTESSPSTGMVFGKSYQRNNSHTSALPDIAAVRSVLRSRSRSVDSELDRTVLISISSDDTEFLLEDVAEERRALPLMLELS